MYSLFYKSQTNPLPFIDEITQEEEVTRILQLIYAHPFNQQLFSGTLSKNSFGSYLQDDFYYLHHYALMLQQLSQRLHSYNLLKLSEQLNYMGTGIIEEEQAMHQHYIQFYVEQKPSKAIVQYVEFLQNQVHEQPLYVALCSILPCFWIYYQLGQQAMKIIQNNNVYQSWIHTYTGNSFVQATLDLVDNVNNLAATASAHLRKEMKVAFMKAATHELTFFDAIIEQNFNMHLKSDELLTISASPLI